MKREAEERWSEVKKRRMHLGGRNRALAFGNLQNTRDCKIAEEKKQNRWNSNTAVKKPLRVASVELTSSRKASARVGLRNISKPAEELSALERKILNNKEALRRRELLVTAIFDDY